MPFRVKHSPAMYAMLVFKCAASIRPNFPEAAKALDRASKAYLAHPGEELPTQEVIRRGWLISLPRFRDRFGVVAAAVATFRADQTRLTWASLHPPARPFAQCCARGAKSNDLSVALSIGRPVSVLALGFGNIDPLALSLAPILVVLAGHLQCQPQQHGLHGFQTILATPSASPARSDRSTTPGMAKRAPLA